MQDKNLAGLDGPNIIRKTGPKKIRPKSKQKTKMEEDRYSM